MTMTGMSLDLFRIQKKEFVMQSVFGRQFGLGRTDRVARDRKAKSRGLQPRVDGLEGRALLSGSVAVSAGVVTVVPDSSVSQNTCIVSYQNVSGVTELDVNLNGVDNYFGLRQVGLVAFQGRGISTNETFTNQTGLTANAYGGAGTNVFTAGSGINVFYGGSGSNTFNAGKGYDRLVGGSGTNAFNLSATGTGMVIEEGGSNAVRNDPPGNNYIVI